MGYSRQISWLSFKTCYTVWAKVNALPRLVMVKTTPQLIVSERHAIVILNVLCYLWRWWGSGEGRGEKGRGEEGWIGEGRCG